jgi:hypothetical protein
MKAHGMTGWYETMFTVIHYSDSAVGYLNIFPCWLQIPRDEEGELIFDELICSSCVPQCPFLSKYPGVVIAPATVPDVSTDAVEIVEQTNGSGILRQRFSRLLSSALVFR